VDEGAPFVMPVDMQGAHQIKLIAYSPAGAEAWDERFIILA